MSKDSPDKPNNGITIAIIGAISGICIAIIGLGLPFAQVSAEKYFATSTPSILVITTTPDGTLFKEVTATISIPVIETSTQTPQKDTVEVPITLTPTPIVIQSEVSVHANKDWQNTSIEVMRGEIITIQYISGQWSPFSGYYTDGQGCTDSRVCTQDLSVLANWPDNITGGIHATLIARIDDGQIIIVENYITLEAQNTGTLAFRINDKNISDNSGSIIVLVKVKP